VSEAYRSAGWAGRQRILDACRQRGLLLVNDSQFTFQAGKSAPAVASPPATPSPVGAMPVAPPHPPPGPTTTAAHPTPLSPSPPPPGGLRPLPPGGLRPMPPPPPPKLVATSTNADRVLSDAQRENLQHNYARALQLARSVQQESPMRAWRTIGSAACGLKDRNLVKEAYLKLDQGGRQYLFFVCQHSGINTDAFNDPKH
jgi:hypothetical protein